METERERERAKKMQLKYRHRLSKNRLNPKAFTHHHYSSFASESKVNYTPNLYHDYVRERDRMRLVKCAWAYICYLFSHIYIYLLGFSFSGKMAKWNSRGQQTKQMIFLWQFIQITNEMHIKYLHTLKKNHPPLLPNHEWQWMSSANKCIRNKC